MSGNVWNSPSGSFMVDMGISSNIMKSPSPKCYMKFWDMIYSDTLKALTDQTLQQFLNLSPNWTLLPNLTLLPNFERFPYNITTDAASQQRTLTPPDNWSCPIWNLHLFCWDHSFLNLSYIRTFWVSNIPLYFYFALQHSKGIENCSKIIKSLAPLHATICISSLMF